MSPAHQRLQEFVRSYGPLSPADWARIAPCWVPFSRKRTEVILREGEVCRHIWFLNAGLARYHYVDEEGGDVTKFFTEPPYIFTAQRSFNARQPSAEAISAVTDCHGLQLSATDADRLFELPAWSTIVRRLIAEVQGFTEDILVEAKALGPEERYRRLLLERPNLVRDLPLKHLSSYLGIAPQSLSRIRRRVLNREDL